MHLNYDPIPNKTYGEISPTNHFKRIIKSINTTPYKRNNEQVCDFIKILIELTRNIIIDNVGLQEIFIHAIYYHMYYNIFLLKMTTLEYSSDCYTSCYISLKP